MPQLTLFALVFGLLPALAILVARFVAGLDMRQSVLAGFAMLVFLSLLAAAAFALRWVVPNPAEIIQGTAWMLMTAAVVLLVISFLRRR